ncbi:MAG: hypothetical protein WD607_04765 [Candidatus Paceibacterota bacterium]
MNSIGDMPMLWGEASMGGRYPGKYPPKMRIVAVLNMLLLGFLQQLYYQKPI